MSKYVLDASALLALLNDEPGAQRVNHILPDSVIGAVNLCETVGKLTNAGMTPDDARASFELLNLEVVPFDANLAYKTAALIAQTRKHGLSLGDRACLSLGMMRNNIVVTADQVWSRLKIGVTIEVIRGNSTRLPDPEN